MERKSAIEDMVGRLMLIEKISGRKFIARLIGIDGDEFYFKNKKGCVSLLKRSAISELTAVEK